MRADMTFELDMGRTAPGMVIGLFGGSFDPPHGGHVHFAREAMKRFRLDSLVWMVSPGNPLKPDAPASFDRRIALCRQIAAHPGIHVSRVEAQLGTRYTAQTVAELRARFRDVRFVWLMGADNLVQFHRWNDWTRIMESVPVGVLARPGYRLAARNSVAARRYRGARLPAAAAGMLGRATAPCWCFVNMPMRHEASSIIRRRGDW